MVVLKMPERNESILFLMLETCLRLTSVESEEEGSNRGENGADDAHPSSHKRWNSPHVEARSGYFNVISELR